MILILDDFYEDPYSIRRAALAASYDDGDNIGTGHRTEYISEFDREIFDFSCKKVAAYVTDDELATYNWVSKSHYQYTPKSFDVEIGSGFIHVDTKLNIEFVSIVYLSPDAPPYSGTAFYTVRDEEKTEVFRAEHSEELKILRERFNKCPTDSENRNAYIALVSEHDALFERMAVVDNKFNRCLIYDAEHYHDACGYFGTTLEDSRLIHISFMAITDTTAKRKYRFM